VLTFHECIRDDKGHEHENRLQPVANDTYEIDPNNHVRSLSTTSANIASLKQPRIIMREGNSYLLNLMASMKEIYQM
jgi:hypothetical protein